MKLQQEQNFKWTSEANIERYGKLLKGRLTDVERRFVERRLAEELDARQGALGKHDGDARHIWF
jgi:hypothetical protein